MKIGTLVKLDWDIYSDSVREVCLNAGFTTNEVIREMNRFMVQSSDDYATSEVYERKDHPVVLGIVVGKGRYEELLKVYFVTLKSTRECYKRFLKEVV
ncbi:MAG: hypothetical protein Q8P81_03540 [Nanoarchaeota archaeon]|nr:hypothetical protein [Nanoarchaeota archaeon]